jgi:hypothetical protein
MRFDALLSALFQRETGPRPLRRLSLWLAVGAGVAALRTAVPDELTPSLVVQTIVDFPTAIGVLLGVAAILQLIARLSEDRLRGWVLGWCGNGGRRVHYVCGLYLAVVLAMCSTLAAAIVAHSLMLGVLGFGFDLRSTVIALAGGVAAICLLSAYGLMFGVLLQRTVAAAVAAAALFFGPFIAMAIIVVAKDLPDAPAWARYAFAYAPPIASGATLIGVLRQVAYVVAVLLVSGWIAERRVARV